MAPIFRKGPGQQKVWVRYTALLRPEATPIPDRGWRGPMMLLSCRRAGRASGHKLVDQFVLRNPPAGHDPTLAQGVGVAVQEGHVFRDPCAERIVARIVAALVHHPGPGGRTMLLEMRVRIVVVGRHIQAVGTGGVATKSGFLLHSVEP